MSELKPNKKKAKFPLSSFGPQLMAILVKGSREKFALHFDDVRQGRALQARLHTLRARMRDENHPQYGVVTRARTSLKWGREAGFMDAKDERKATLTIYPHDSQFNAVLEEAGFAVETLKEDPIHHALAPEPNRPAGEPEGLAELLAQLPGGGVKQR